MLTIFGLFLTILVPFFFLTWRRILAPDGQPLGRLRRVAMFAAGIALALSLFDLGALAHLSLRQAVSIRTFALAMTAFGIYLTLHRATPERHRRPLVLATFAFALVAGCEFVFVWDRMNTVFKFYLEAWLLFGLASGTVLCELFRGGRARSRWRLAWQGIVGAAVAVAAFTSVSGAWGTLTHRHTAGPRWTLDGTAYLKRSDPQELAAFEWINRNVTGLPVLVEAYGPSYGEYARVAMNTGLPIVLGWDYHVFQRGHGWAEINRRKADIETIFTSKDEPRVAAVLRRYHAALVYVGPLERRTYAGGNLADFTKWTDLLTPVYRNPAVTIFAVNGSSIGAPPPLTIETTRRSPRPRRRRPRPRTRSASSASRGASPAIAPATSTSPTSATAASRSSTATSSRWQPGAGGGPPRASSRTPATSRSVRTATSTSPTPGTAACRSSTPPGATSASSARTSTAPAGSRWTPAGACGWRTPATTGSCASRPPASAISSSAARPDNPNLLAAPTGIAVDAHGRVYVCDNDHGRLAVFDANGALVTAFPVPGWRREVFSEPYVSISGEGLCS